MRLTVAGRPLPRDPEAGDVSPVLIIVLLVIVALFVFAVLTGARGGLSSSGCLPDDAQGRRAQFDRWFAPASLAPTEMKLTNCTLSGQLLLTINGACVIEVASLPEPPRSWTEKIASAFHSDRRRLFSRPAPDVVRITLVKAPPANGPTPDPISGKLTKPADVTFAPDMSRSLQLGLYYAAGEPAALPRGSVPAPRVTSEEG